MLKEHGFLTTLRPHQLVRFSSHGLFKNVFAPLLIPKKFMDLFKQQCGVGQFTNDVLLQTIVDELVTLHKEVEAVSSQSESGKLTGGGGVSFEPPNLAALSNEVKSAVAEVEAKGAELDRLITNLIELDNSFKQLITEAAKSFPLEAGKAEYSKQDIKAIVTKATENGGSQLLDQITEVKERIRKVFNERRQVWEACQTESIDRVYKDLDKKIAELKSKCALPIDEETKSVIPPTPAQAVAKAEILTSMATMDGVWPVNNPSATPTPSTIPVSRK
eukprot:Blabericola_migrator_1__7443@NODE_3795_length_1504_cov_67_805150_g2353_i0_p1_GENE_NODE_3795_length_1504_cov_67_805150_g2353_i0NODE_3795_length_1504_cov_67_805150_g2353_i0_p1_ORF_typecomplete_len275_score41_40Spc7/PF08317_11/0_054Spc7/PF08317_11/6_3GldM_N/PF12081_8/0_00089DUF3584/PF12128_8/30DUF3584/PF12128_8/0_013Laminin_I/PF06008_14/1e03Laminin_I/PF06008_14/0_0027Baculo_PEP_C/PF04513_12/1_2Baculo_PEP_C/PF04513_12/9_8DUF2203/PF09969_9/0_27DUF2203/PF09969_9/2_5e02DUF2203/PF09969_9/2_6e02CheZ/PF04